MRLRTPTVDRDQLEDQRDRAMETLTDPRIEPHLFLAGLLTTTLALATLLFLLFPDF